MVRLVLLAQVSLGTLQIRRDGRKRKSRCDGINRRADRTRKEKQEKIILTYRGSF